MAIYSELFTDNKYLRWYASIVESAKTRDSRDIYTEIHHIVPKCMGGSNKKSNLVVLTYREHFLCHWLLPKFVLTKKYNKKMLHALTFMVGDNKLAEKTFTSWQYEVAKKAAKQSMFGENNNFYGKKHTKETSEKMSAGQKRHNELYGRPKHRPETLEKLRIARKGKKASEAHILAMKKYHENTILYWYTNGKECMMIPDGNPIPAGFIRGRGTVCNKLKGLVYYNNGTINKRFRRDGLIPTGFVEGQLRKQK